MVKPGPSVPVRVLAAGAATAPVTAATARAATTDTNANSFMRLLEGWDCCRGTGYARPRGTRVGCVPRVAGRAAGPLSRRSDGPRRGGDGRCRRAAVVGRGGRGGDALVLRQRGAADREGRRDRPRRRRDPGQIGRAHV